MNRDNRTLQSKSKKIELVLHQLNSLPTLPAVATRLLQITSQTNTQAQEVVRLIESDPSLASKIIAMATSASTGVSRKTASLAKTVVLLGFDAVRNAVLSIKVFEALGKVDSSNQNQADGFDRVGFWKHSLAVACGDKMLIKHLDPKVDPEEAFICGLLHDIGKLALFSCLPKSYNRVVQLTESAITNIADVEQKILGIDHTVAGKRLMEKWHVPEAITESVWLHHHWVQGLPDMIHHRKLVIAVHLADILAREQRIGYSGNHTFTQSSEALAAELGLPDNILEKISRDLRKAISERADLLGLDDVVPNELYHEALSNANNELGQLNLRLQNQNNQLKIRSSYFELLTQLTQSTQAGHNIVDLCGIGADLWQSHTKCQRCGVYVAQKDEFIIEGAVKLEPDSQISTFLIDRTEDPDYSNPDALVIDSHETCNSIQAGFSVSLVNESHNWFFEQVAPMFDMSTTLTIPLMAGDDFVGGILWQSDNAGAESYRDQLKEMQAFASSMALALRQVQAKQQQINLCEQLTQNNKLLQTTQVELYKKRSMASVGEMAAGAAHEINNPLAVIVGRSQLLAASEDDPEKKSILVKIVEQGKQITDIITDLMEFAKPALPKPKEVAVPDLIDMAIKQTSKQDAFKNITFDTKLDFDLPDMFIDQAQLSNAIAELFENAAESYENKHGTITIRGTFNELDNVIALEIIDQGCGMDQETVTKACDPFFSAKKAGRKRGLGLSRSIRSIETNGGEIRIISKPEKGTIVRVALPISQESAIGELSY